MSLRGKLICLLIVACAAGAGHGSRALAADAFVNYAALGRAKFTAKKYDEAIDLFRKHLRRAPKDYNVWNQLGAAYYHTGQPRKALRYLKHVERTTTEKSYNYYYQGLCYTASESPDKAKEFFTYGAQRFTDEYASRATFEVAVIEYNAKNKPKANYWLTLYMQRYPTGVYAPQAQRLIQSLRENKWIDGVEGTKKPDMEEALFKYNKLSLTTKPHFWFLQGGWDYQDISGQEPASGGGLKPQNAQNMAALVNAGIGMGPYRQGDITATVGYTYRQIWNTDLDRVSEWTDSPTDIQYFPLRGDLLERHHQFYVDLRRDISGLFYFGVYARYEIAKIGSSLFPSPDPQELRKVLPISDTELVIPWAGLAYGGNMRTLAYLYLRKELNQDTPDYSNKTYNLGLTGGSTPVMSFGVSHTMDFPEINLNIDIEAFQYEFIYNDYWLDYKRDGIIVGGEAEVIPRWFINGLVGYYTDAYVLPRLKLRTCGAQPPAETTTDPTASATPHTCPRTDTGYLYQIGVYWNWTQFQRISAFIQDVENKNPTQQEYGESKQTIQVMYTMAFPSVARVSHIIDRYADSAFTKDPYTDPL